LRASAGCTTQREQKRTQGLLRQVPERASRARYTAVAGRTRSTDLRERLARRLEAVGRADENDSQRVPSDAVAERGTGARCEAHGGFLLRPGFCPASRLRSAADQIAPTWRNPKRATAPVGTADGHRRFRWISDFTPPSKTANCFSARTQCGFQWS